jgi:Flp pilus assembly protein TadG
MSKLRLFAINTEGSAAAEFALVLPLLAYLFLNVADFSLYVWSKMQVDLAAQEAVGAARALCDKSTAAQGLPALSNCTAVATKMNAAAQTTSLATSVTVLATDIKEGWYCANSTGTLTRVDADPMPATPPNPTCTGTIAGSTATPGDYISAKATHTFSSMFPGASIVSLVPALNAPITSTAWMRLQ